VETIEAVARGGLHFSRSAMPDITPIPGKGYSILQFNQDTFVTLPLEFNFYVGKDKVPAINSTCWIVCMS
jgi:hypothetical protein